MMKNLILGTVIAWVVVFGVYLVSLQLSSYSDLVFAGNYQAYDPTQNQIDSDKVTVLDFYATRCPSCVSSHKNFLANADKIPDTLQILNINYDEAAVLKQKYAVTSQHTFVLVDREGNFLKKTNGLGSVEDVIEFVGDYRVDTVIQELWKENSNDVWSGTLQEIVKKDSISDQDIQDTTSKTPTNLQADNKPGIYTDYESGKKYIGDTSKRVVLFFHASRCPTCKLAKKNILEEQDNIPSDLVILELDYDTQTALKEKHGVVAQTTYVFLNNDSTTKNKTVWLTTLQSLDTFAQ